MTGRHDCGKVELMKRPPNDPGHMLRGVAAGDFTRRLMALRTLRPRLLSDEQVYERLKRALNGYVLNPVEYVGQALFRVRINNEDSAYEEASELWYPPAQFVQARGRFNGVGETLFYCCDSMDAAAVEVMLSEPATLTVLVAGLVNSSVLPKCVHIGLQHLRPHNNFRSNLPGGLREDFAFLQSLERMRIKDRWLKLDELCANLAMKICDGGDRDDHYKITGALARYLLRMECAGIMYPSVATEYKALNIAFKPDAADQLLFPAEAWMVYVEPAVGEITEPLRGHRKLHRVKALRRSENISASGAISWSRPLEDDSILPLLKAPTRIRKYREQRVGSQTPSGT